MGIVEKHEPQIKFNVPDQGTATLCVASQETLLNDAFQVLWGRAKGRVRSSYQRYLNGLVDG